MKKVVLLTVFFLILLSKLALNAQNIGLKWQTAGKSTSVSPRLSNATNSGIQLNLPKSDDALLRIRQNVYYAQNRYPQAYLNRNRGYANYYEINDRQLQVNGNQKTLFYDRLIEVAIVKLFKLD
jgi:hypothetical protein